MPAGLLLLNSAGLITSANPAAEIGPRRKSLVYRRYSEVLGAGVARSRELLAGCLEHGTDISSRRSGISDARRANCGSWASRFRPILNGTNDVTGAICLLSDLTELAALQKQIHMKENLAALGELSAGIAHEFKNALATISGYAQMIRSEAQPGTEIREHGAAHPAPDARADARRHRISEICPASANCADEQVAFAP